MNGASKILTVSYGTFSCTLEGFDEPFNTMKAIAEYFRDLASEDRYFGAEPPTPDAAMLHRIAEREIQRRVDAKINENGVILRADHSVPVSVPAVAQAAAAQPAPVRPPVVQAAPALTEAPAAETVAARLSRLRSESVAPAVVLASDYIEDEHADPIPAPQPVVEASRPEPEQPVTAAVPAQPVEDVRTADDEIAADEILAGLDAALAASEPVAAAEPQDALIEAAFDIPEALVPVAEDRSVTEAHVVAEAPVEDFDLSDLIADAMPAESDLRDTQAEVEFADLLPETVTEPAVSDDPADQIPELSLDDLDLDLDGTADFAEPEGDEAEPAGEDLANDEDVLARLADDLGTPTVEDALADDAGDAQEDAPVAETGRRAVRRVVPVAAPAAPAVSDTPAVSDKLQRARARVIHVRRSATLDPTAQAPAALPAAAEEDLQRQLAALAEESLRGAATAADDTIAIESLPADQHPRLAPEADAAAVERLIAQTNTAMAGPENKRRLSAIAHLKAAVAATLADRLSRGTSADAAPSREDAYRDDLERVVRPQRPTLAEAPATPAPDDHAPAPRQAGDRPAPLVLISEQRIDRTSRPAAPAQIVPVRPRRVSPPAAAVIRPVPAPQPLILGEDEEDTVEDTAELFADSRGFAEFAEKLGATDLAGMLEAAAAYAACIEGRPHFSRPQLIRQVAALAEEEISREDSLRSFGRLLRDGRIVKLRRGQFALTDRSHLLAEAKKIAG